MNPHAITRDFERELCNYTGAPYAVAVNSCTMALLLAVAWHRFGLMMPRGVMQVEIPKRTYVSVPQSIIHAGGRPTFRDEAWRGAYRLKPLPVFDSARWFTSGIFTELQWAGATMACVSFHWTKTLGTGFRQGGAILHDNPEADAWLRRARFDGRTEGVAPKDDNFDVLGWHCYMDPTTAEALLEKLRTLPKHNAPLPNDEYPDLSEMPIFK